MNSILLLLQFFTRIPIKKELNYSDEAFKKSIWFMPILSVITAVPIFLVSYLGVKLGNYSIFALLTLVTWIIVTGAFHLDGFSDTCDGLFSGRQKDRILEIMKDSRIGSYGTIGIILVLMFKGLILKEIITLGRPDFILLILLMGKISLLLTAYFGKPAKEKSSGNVFINGNNSNALIFNIIFMLIFGYFLGELLKTSVALLGTVIFTLAFNLGTYRIIGGIVGDNLGFSNEVGELIIGIILIWH